MAKNTRGGEGRYKGGAGVTDADIISTQDMISERANYPKESSDVLSVARDLRDQYGDDGLIGQFLVAQLSPKAMSAIAYYDGNNIGVNSRFMDSKAIEDSYAECVKAGFHPSKGNKTAMQAVAAHEYGHALTDSVARRLGLASLDAAADRIVNEARSRTKHRGVVKMAARISRYATQSNAEAIAEAFSDVYCNGNKAHSESIAIVDVLNGYLGKK